MSIDLLQQPRQEQRLSPQTLQVMNLLCCSFQELNSFIQEQFEANPALEFTVPIRSSDISIDRISGARSDDDVSKWDLPANVSFQEHLKAQLAFCSLTASEKKAALLIIDSLEDNGYLLIPISTLSESSGLSTDLLHAALLAVQRMDPPGVGARDVSECLILQLYANGSDDHVLRAIISNDLLLVAQRKYANIAKANNITVKQAEAYCDEIRRMRPYPCINSGSIQYIVPDVTVQRREDGLEVLWHDDAVPSLQVNPEFSLLGPESDEERRYCKECLQGARDIVHMLEMRRITMEKIVTCMVSAQQDFFLGGSALKPLSYDMVASISGVHVSTVYRGTQNKYLRCSMGTYPFRYFMQQSIGDSGMSKDSVKKLICEMVAETPKLSDREISERLEEHGVHVARRTVAKYKEELGLKPARSDRV